MAGSHRHDSSLLTDAHVHGGGGLGVLGADIPSTGADGPPPLYNDSLDPDKEYRYLPTLIPSGLTIFFYEDSSFVAPPAADGTYVVEGTAYEDGQSYGTPTVTLTWGASEGSVSGQTLIASASVIAGSASGAVSAAVTGQTLTVAASAIAGSVVTGAAVAGQVLTVAASVIAGAITAAGTVAGQMLSVAMSIRRGGASDGTVMPARGQRLSIGVRTPFGMV